MAIFAIVALDQNNSANISGAVEAAYQSGTSFKVAQGHYLVKESGTAQSVAEKLTIPGGARGHVMVYNISGYFGFGPNTTWEWLKSNFATGA